MIQVNIHSVKASFADDTVRAIDSKQFLRAAGLYRNFEHIVFLHVCRVYLLTQL